MTWLCPHRADSRGFHEKIVIPEVDCDNISPCKMHILQAPTLHQKYKLLKIKWAGRARSGRPRSILADHDTLSCPRRCQLCQLLSRHHGHQKFPTLQLSCSWHRWNRSSNKPFASASTDLDEYVAPVHECELHSFLQLLCINLLQPNAIQLQQLLGSSRFVLLVARDCRAVNGSRCTCDNKATALLLRASKI